MRTLCFSKDYSKRIARVKEFCNEEVEVVFDKFLKEFCNEWLEEEYILQSGAERYERSSGRLDIRGGHYERWIISGRGPIQVRVPRGVERKYTYSLFKPYKRKTEHFESVVVEAILQGHSSRKASVFFSKLFGQDTISHQAAVATLRRFDYSVVEWKKRKLRDNPVVVVLDAGWFKGVNPNLKGAKPVLYAYAVYGDGKEEVLDFEIASGESKNAWVRFCQKLEYRGLKNIELIVHDDNAGIEEAIALVWPRALDQACVFHMMQNFTKRLKGCIDKHEIIYYVSWLYEASSKEEFMGYLEQFRKRWIKYEYHPAFIYLYKKILDTIKYFHIPKGFWHIAKTTNRLERLFEELKRRIRVFRRFPNTLSCERWTFALLNHLNKVNNSWLLSQSQHTS